MALNAQLGKLGSTIFLKHGFPGEVFSSLLDEYDVEKVFTNHDYEPYARDRDLQISKLLESKSISFNTYKDQVIMEKSEVVKENNTPYTVFTPYSNRWKATATNFYFDSYPVKNYRANFFKTEPSQLPSLRSLGFEATDVSFPSIKAFQAG